MRSMYPFLLKEKHFLLLYVNFNIQLLMIFQFEEHRTI